MLFVFTLIFTLVASEGAKILAILPAASHSHGIWNRVLMEALAERGHHVVALTPDPGTSTTNLRYINLENTYVTYNGSGFLDGILNFSALGNSDMFFEWILMTCQSQFQSKGLKEFLESKDSYDLVIFEVVGNECFLGLLPKIKAPVVAVSAYGCATWNHDVMGVPEMLAVYPHHLIPYSTQMTFLQRLENIALTWYTQLVRKFFHIPRMDKMSREMFGDDIPSLEEIERNYSVMLVNSGPPGVDPPRAYPPAVVQVGCLHCRPAKPLPQDLQQYLDEASNGAIFFSLGSNIQSNWMSSEKLKQFIDAFSELHPLRVLWKWESDTLPGQPSNVKLGKWLPQQDILAHPNLKLFITHGGKLSTQEALFHGVPVLALPVFIDQHTNAQRAEEYGVGLSLPLAKATKTTLLEKLKVLLNNDTFQKSARAKSEIIRDQPEKPLDRAVFWTEYVLRHTGAPHLRSAATHLAWYQLHLLDVAVVIVLVILSLVVFIKNIFTKICNSPRKNNNKSGKVKKRQ